ncbi:prepilin-type cleavage/methylation domain-containing protein [Synechococcus sp. CBW1004]|uniref:prepilin-type cleavage/methylation domain-containing protein n=1 Tax=Synechococcus sp. CBW1004 TaxID=1353136 RepID=UPI0018CF5D63|nr:prepilin-type cleavage/methylation domain-containing protein [Synechococcus sp. CBW1004]QPN64746.1 prepilin-type cleavage/methylation domain-containing protein [Synechococcus sp. CBW1004]
MNALLLQNGRSRRRRPERSALAIPGRSAGLTLVELLLGLSLGMALFVTLLQTLLLHGRGNERLVRLVRERGVQRRTLALLRSEILRADRLELGESPGLQPACSLAGRRPVLQLQTARGTISYTLSPPPSAIWRGQVLMRCGPAYGLDGEPSTGSSLNRVLLDGLATGGFEASRSGPGQLRLKLQQEFRLTDGHRQTISSAVEIATAERAP